MGNDAVEAEFRRAVKLAFWREVEGIEQIDIELEGGDLVLTAFAANGDVLTTTMPLAAPEKWRRHKM